MTFEEYLIQKKIDGAAFQQAEPSLYAELAGLFIQMHPKSFTAQKLYLINPIRRRFLLGEKESTGTTSKPKPGRPVIKKPQK